MGMRLGTGKAAANLLTPGCDYFHLIVASTLLPLRIEIIVFTLPAVCVVGLWQTRIDLVWLACVVVYSLCSTLAQVVP